jgi:hypothetical protein
VANGKFARRLIPTPIGVHKVFAPGNFTLAAFANSQPATFWNQKPAGQKLKREITSKPETG